MKTVKYYRTMYDNIDNPNPVRIHAEEGCGEEFNICDDKGRKFTLYRERIDNEYRITEKTTGASMARDRRKQNALDKSLARINEVYEQIENHKYYFAPAIRLMSETYSQHDGLKKTDLLENNTQN